MITAKVVTPDNQVRPAFVTGYSSFSEAEKALRLAYPIEAMRVSNALVLKDYQGQRLVLQEVKQ